MIFSAGADILANNQIVFDTPEVVTAFEKLREIATSKSILLGAPTDSDDPSAFINGLTAIQWIGLWTMPAIIKGLGNDFGVIPWPASGSNGKPVASWGALPKWLMLRANMWKKQRPLSKPSGLTIPVYSKIGP